MIAKSKHWESYVDGAGRTHWRWPAPPRPAADHTAHDAARPRAGRPATQQVSALPLRTRGR